MIPQKPEFFQKIIIKKLIRKGIIKEEIPFSQAQALISSLIKNTNILTDKENDVLKKRIFQFMSHITIGRQYKVTRERIRQIENRALSKLAGRWPVYPKKP